MSVNRAGRARRPGVVVLIVLLALLPAGLGPAQAVSGDIVISQVYGGGGNAGATLKHDFIELFNRGASPVSVTGWSVQYASAGGGNWSKTDLAGTILPGQYYLIQQAQGPGGTLDLPTPDVTGTSALGAASGKIALVTNQTLLTCGAGASCLPNPAIRDFVGYGSAANNFEGPGPTSTLGNDTAALRAGGGCTDADNNRADFTAGSPVPRHSGSPLHACGGIDLAPAVSSTVPGRGATNVAPGSSITIHFTEAVNVLGDWFTIACATSGVHAAAVSGGPQTFTLTRGTSFAPGESCTVTVSGSQITDLDLDDPPNTMAADYLWSFTTAGDQTRIGHIQGAGHVSPRNGRPVDDVPGIVTAKRSNGFFMQDPDPDGDPATSEGIFVFTASAPSVTVGDAVLVSGTVTEFRQGGNTSPNLSLTQITAPSITVSSSGNPLPTPVAIGTGGRLPPTVVIRSDAPGDVDASPTFDAALNGLDFYESLEGMLVQVNDAVVVGPRRSSGELVVLADDGTSASVRTARGGILVRTTDFNPERITVGDALRPTPAVSVGDRFTGPIVGVVDYSRGGYLLQATQPLTASGGGLSPGMASPAGPDQLAIATFNVENLNPKNPQSKFDRLARLIVNNLQSPDIIAVEEIQDNSGPDKDGEVRADLTYRRLTSAIQAAGGPSYQVAQIDPQDGEDGGESGGNIRVGFLYRTDRGLSFVERPGGDATTPTRVQLGATGPELSLSPGRVDPLNSAFEDSRKPLAGEFSLRGHKLFVIANHFTSKGGDQPLFGRFQPPVLGSESKRVRQAQSVHAFVSTILGHDPNANVVVLGDFNDFEFSTTLNTLKGSLLHNLMEALPLNERYSYVFGGNSQALDHTLVSTNLFANTPFEYEVVHVNAEFSVQASDHDPQVARFSLP